MAARPAAFRLPSDQAPFAAALLRLAAWTAVAVAWKSPFWSVADPEKPPVWTSARQVPCVVKGLVPLDVLRRRRRIAETIVAPSGIGDVLNETTDLYWRSLAASPTRSVLVPLTEPPAPEVSDDSSTQPSWAAIEVRVTTVGDDP